MDKNIIIAGLIFKYLRGELSIEEERILDVWLENPENREYLWQMQETETLYTNIAEMWETDTKEAERAFASIERAARRKYRLSVFKYAAGVVAIIALAIGIYRGALNKGEPEPLVAKDTPFVFDKEGAILETSRGDIHYVTDSVGHGNIIRQNSSYIPKEINTLRTFRQKITSVRLDDGTRVWLNAESILEYPDHFKGKKRIVHLSGEAFFEVAHNVDKPFIVKTENADIRVLGTTFNLNATGNHSITTLVEGSVQIKNSRDVVVVLSPGQQASLNDKDDISVRNVDVSYSIAWRKKLFAFENQQLILIIAAIAQWYGMSYEFDNDALQETRYTSIIRKYDNVSEILNVLNEMNEFTARVTDNTIKISKE